MDRASLYAVVAAREALESAGLITAANMNVPEECGVILGAGLSGLETLQTQTEILLERGPSKVSPLTIPILMPNASAANVSMAFGVKGPCYVTSSACASSGHAMIDAYRHIITGEYPFMITGGTEASLTRLGMSAFIRMRAMAKGFNNNPIAAIKPFDLQRTGLIMSEGSGVLIFEELEHAQARGAEVIAEVIGFGSTADGYDLVRPAPDGYQFLAALKQMFRMVGLSPSEIAAATYVNAHGTGTLMNDAIESKALCDMFGDSARQLRISSTKSMTGHMIGATCGLEMMVCAYALKTGYAPPTINFSQADPNCSLNYIPNHAIQGHFEYAINNALGFGGHNVTLMLKRYSE
jgi:3-oxoacyl-[acyl-carrier-protein] synthase II